MLRSGLNLTGLDHICESYHSCFLLEFCEILLGLTIQATRYISEYENAHRLVVDNHDLHAIWNICDRFSVRNTLAVGADCSAMHVRTWNFNCSRCRQLHYRLNPRYIPFLRHCSAHYDTKSQDDCPCAFLLSSAVS